MQAGEQQGWVQGAQPLVFASIRATAWGTRRQAGRDGCGVVVRLAKDGAGGKGNDLSLPDTFEMLQNKSHVKNVS